MDGTNFMSVKYCLTCPIKVRRVTAKGQKGQEQTEAVPGVYRGLLEEATCAIGDVQ